MSRATAFAAVLTTLLLAGLACNLPGQPNMDANATVAALSTAIRQTAAVQTQAAGGVRVATFTPAPAIDTAPPPVPTETSAPPAAALQRPNGGVLHAWHMTVPMEINGDLSEWGRLPYSTSQVVFGAAAWAGAADNSLDFALSWDSGYLYVAAQVTDDLHVQTQHGELIFKGDIVEMLLDADLAGDFDSTRLSSDDFQIGFSPGALSGNSPEAYLWFPAGLKGQPSGVALAARAVGTGYALEAAVPWSLIGVTPSAGATFGFAVSLSDNDAPGLAEQHSMVSSAATRKLADPTTWGTLVLDN